MTSVPPTSIAAYECARRRTLTAAALAFLTMGTLVPFMASATEGDAPVEASTYETTTTTEPEVLPTTTTTVPESTTTVVTTTLPSPTTTVPLEEAPCLTGEAGVAALSATINVSGGLVRATVTNNASAPVCSNVHLAAYLKTNDNDWPDTGLQTLFDSAVWNESATIGLAAGASTELTVAAAVTVDNRVCPMQIDVVYEDMRGEPFKNQAYPYTTINPATSQNYESADYNWGDLVAGRHWPEPSGTPLAGCGEIEISQEVTLDGCTPITLDQINPIWFRIQGTPAAGTGAPFVRWVNMTPSVVGEAVTFSYRVSAGTYAVTQVAGDGSNVAYTDPNLTATTSDLDDGDLDALGTAVFAYRSTFTECVATTTTSTTTTTPPTTTTTLVEATTTTSTTVVEPTNTTTIVLGQATTPPRVAVKGQQLARTGQQSAATIMLSGGLLLTGAGLLGLSRRPRRRRFF